MSCTVNTYNPALQHMEVSGNDWEQWRARIWNQMADGFLRVTDCQSSCR